MRRLDALKLLLLCLAAVLFLVPLATPVGVLAALLGVVVGDRVGRQVAASGVRTSFALLFACALCMLGYAISEGLGALGLALPVGATLLLNDVVLFSFYGFASVFALRVLVLRHPSASVVELGIVFAAAASIVADHRHHRIEHPRFLSDWAWSRGIDPSVVLVIAGAMTLLIAALLLLRTPAWRSYFAVLVVALLLFAAGPGLKLAAKPPDTLQDGGGSGGNNDAKDNADGGGSGRRDQRPPDPVAILLLHEELPPSLDALYLRQSVMSRMAGDRLVEDNTAAFDTDVLNQLRPGEPTRADTSQSPVFHQALHTSVFLLREHAQLFGPAHPIELRALPNPDPRRFTGAYDVDSLVLRVSPTRLLGRGVVSDAWSEEEKQHYLAAPTDPRYKELSQQIVRDVDPRFVGDAVMSALAIKRHLEKEGVYNSTRKHLSGDTPTAQFLFGDLHGYCVHFAHAAALLLRSQGIPSRVAVGYGVQTLQRGAGSAVMVTAQQAHAWPEIYVAGVGWVTFDIHPERSDEPPPQLLDTEMESMLGELARADKTAGRGQQDTIWVFPTQVVLETLAAIAFAFALLGYCVRVTRRLRRGTHVTLYRGVLDDLSALGAARLPNESRERHASRVAALAPSFVALTQAHLRWALGRHSDVAGAAVLAAATRLELKRGVSRPRRLLALLNPFAWMFTR